MNEVKGKIFLSHSVGDRLVARRVKSCLEQRGYSCFVAPDDMPKALSLSNGIKRGIEQADQVVFLISRNMRNSEWIEREALFAIDYKKKTAHVLVVDGAEIPLYLLSRVVIDPGEGRLEDGLEQLLRDVEAAAVALAPA